MEEVAASVINKAIAVIIEEASQTITVEIVAEDRFVASREHLRRLQPAW